jgi:ornithine--oxo-acid transaminase
MAPGAIQTESPTTTGTGLKATARAFHPTGTPDPSKYHSASTAEAIGSEAKFAAHNYHPLPIGMCPLLQPHDD